MYVCICIFVIKGYQLFIYCISFLNSGALCCLRNTVSSQCFSLPWSLTELMSDYFL